MEAKFLKLVAKEWDSKLSKSVFFTGYEKYVCCVKALVGQKTILLNVTRYTTDLKLSNGSFKPKYYVCAGDKQSEITLINYEELLGEKVQFNDIINAVKPMFFKWLAYKRNAVKKQAEKAIANYWETNEAGSFDNLYVHDWLKRETIKKLLGKSNNLPSYRGLKLVIKKVSYAGDIINDYVTIHKADGKYYFEDNSLFGDFRKRTAKTLKEAIEKIQAKAAENFARCSKQAEDKKRKDDLIKMMCEELQRIDRELIKGYGEIDYTKKYKNNELKIVGQTYNGLYNISMNSLTGEQISKVLSFLGTI